MAGRAGPGRGEAAHHHPEHHHRCVAWHRTAQCDPHGPLLAADPAPDRGCAGWLRRGSGYCECTGGVATRLAGCGYHFFSCAKACAALDFAPAAAVPLPAKVTCAVGSTAVPHARLLLEDDPLAGAAAEAAGRRLRDLPLGDGRRGAIEAALRGVAAACAAAAPAGPPPLPPRDRDTSDFVAEGWRWPPAAVAEARRQLEGFRAGLGAYPPNAFGGRGIAMVGGGSKYTALGLLGVLQLRRRGCSLPVEMFFAADEFPTGDLIEDLGELGVRARKLPRPGADGDAGADGGDDGPYGLGRFALKVVALLAASFEEVLLLDTDNLPLADPEFIFDDPGYAAAGNVLWPDFWFPTPAPDWFLVAGLEAEEGAGEGAPAGRTTESGQLVFDKRRHWAALQFVFFLNAGDVYYKLLSDYMGQGDKETFAAGLRLAGGAVNLLRPEVAAAGRFQRSCQLWAGFTACSEEFGGSAMLQHAPDGAPLFLHSNMDKLVLAVPPHFGEYRQRWTTVMPGRRDFGAVLGRPEFERELFQDKLRLRCLTSLGDYSEYHRERERALYDRHAGDPWVSEEERSPRDLVGFHTYPPSLIFRKEAHPGHHRAWFQEAAQ